MISILHTADLHLQEHGDERWEALQHLLDIGRSEKIDLLVISGDMFDQGIDAENLRNELRKVFDDTGFMVTVLPGNHDRDAFSGGKFFGRSVRVITDPLKPIAYKDVLIWGIPFRDLEETETIRMLRSLSKRLPEDKTNILLYHGELLDPRFPGSEMGAEDEQRYMPVKLSYFDDLGFDYVLAGHLHTNFRIWETGGCYFVYPGSPVSITRKELGCRQANLFRGGEPPAAYPLKTFHYEQVVVELDPRSAADPLEMIKSRLKDRHPGSQTELLVKGYLDGAKLGTDETMLADKINKFISGEYRVNLSAYEVRDIREILNDRLFERFMAKLEEKEKNEQHRSFIRDLVIQAMLEARA